MFTCQLSKLLSSEEYLLIYAINNDTPHHSKAKKWLEDSLSNDEPFGFAWIVILGFLRIVANGMKSLRLRNS